MSADGRRGDEKRMMTERVKQEGVKKTGTKKKSGCSGWREVGGLEGQGTSDTIWRYRYGERHLVTPRPGSSAGMTSGPLLLAGPP